MKATYTIRFANEVLTNYTEEQVLNFVKIAMLHNKDISKAIIERNK